MSATGFVYVCAHCGHETRTVGGSLRLPARCFRYIDGKRCDGPILPERAVA